MIHGCPLINGYTSIKNKEKGSAKKYTNKINNHDYKFCGNNVLHSLSLRLLFWIILSCTSDSVCKVLLYFDIDSMHVGHPSVSVNYLFLHVPHMIPSPINNAVDNYRN